jgi:dihydrodipicolinate synthase/N-acetylneuraminate lyase
MSRYPQPPTWVRTALQDGIAIPASPLALTRSRRWDERRQKALTRYYHAAGVGGIAVGVHTTQFQIREAKYDLFKPLLALAAQTVASCDTSSNRQTVRIAGICGLASQACAEATFALETGYHAGLLSLSALRAATEVDLLEHCHTVAREIPLIGFYLQPAAGGRLLSFDFWRRFAEIENVIAIKIAPFNRYQTLDVIRAVVEAGRDDIALYTGNDDNIVQDLLTPFQFRREGKTVERRIVGGLLGHWAVWTKRAVELHAKCRRLAQRTEPIPAELLRHGIEITDANAAFFDAAHAFAGCIPGLHEVLRRQGLLESTACLDPNETLQPGQREDINRVYAAYLHLNDDDFVAQHLAEWLR